MAEDERENAMHVIAVDAMGGDNAPQAIVEGVNQAIADFKDIEIQLYGDEAKIKTYLTANERVSIVHTDEKINSDDEPAKAIRKKKKASMVLGAQAVKEKKAGAVISAGNTGLMSTMPSFTGQPFDMLDLGANAENTASHLHQYAILGSFYAKNVRGIANPRVGLLNNRTEETKGDSLRKEAFELLSKEPSINFVGNVEAREIMSGAADVVVADGFTGNAVLKAIEGTGLGAMKTLKSAIMNGGLKAKLGAFLLKDSLKGMKETMDYSSAGGAVLFGLKAPVVKCHGSSDAKAVYYTIKQVRTMLDTKVVEQLVEAFSPKEEAN